MEKLELRLAATAASFALVTQFNVIGLIGIDSLNLLQITVTANKCRYLTFLRSWYVKKKKKKNKCP